MAFDRMYLVSSLLYAAAGMLLGIVMAASQNHVQHVTHAHVLLVGFVVSFIYAVLYKLWLGKVTGALATGQFVLHQAGAISMVIGLFLLYGNFLPMETMDPVLAVSSILVLSGLLLMLVLFLKSGSRTTARSEVIAPDPKQA